MIQNIDFALTNWNWCSSWNYAPKVLLEISLYRMVLHAFCSNACNKCRNNGQVIQSNVNNVTSWIKTAKIEDDLVSKRNLFGRCFFSFADRIFHYQTERIVSNNSIVISDSIRDVSFPLSIAGVKWWGGQQIFMQISMREAPMTVSQNKRMRRRSLFLLLYFSIILTPCVYRCLYKN